MEFTRLGHTGLQVSRIGLGCMTFGDPDRGAHAWTLSEADSRPLIRQAVEVGINFFDTANIYSNGHSEEILGRALAEFAPRDEIVVATKVRNHWAKGPNRSGLSRKAIFTEIDASLQRLGMDHVDLYQIHRWDAATPIEETMQALHDVSRPARRATSVPRQWPPGNSPRPSRWRRAMAGRDSSACSRSGACCTGRKSVRWCRCASTRAWA